jgi:hypothetical protein
MFLRIIKSSSFKTGMWIFNILLCVLIGRYCYVHRASSNSQLSISFAKVSNAVVLSTPQKDNEYVPISFDLLGGYPYEEPYYIGGKLMNDPKTKIPDNVSALSGKKVSIRGFFYPINTGDGGTIKDFLLLRNQITCCFGCAVNTNEWLSVAMSNDKPFKADFTSRPVTLYGTIDVGAKYESGSLVNLYRMKADKLVED